MRSGAVVASAVRELIEPTVRGLGYELVDVQRAAHGLLRVTVDTTSSTRGIGLDAWERVSPRRGRKSGVESEPQGTLELPLAAIEKAHLVPQFDFRGAGRGAGRAPSGYEKAGSEERRG